MASTITDRYMSVAQNDFLVRDINAPLYKMLRVPLNNITSSSIPIGPSTNTLLEWKLPTLVYNLSRSYIEYNIHVETPGALSRVVTHEDVFDLGGAITFGAAGGLDIVNLQWTQNYTKIRRKIDSNIDDFLTNDDTSGLYPSNKLAAENCVPYTVKDDTSPSGAKHKGVINYLENTYAYDGSKLNQAVDRYRRYPLSAFGGTILGVDRDFYGGTQEMYLRVNAGTGDKIAFSTTAANDNVEVATGAASVNNLSINNVYLHLCVEKNEEIIKEFHDKFRSNTLKFAIPFTTAFKIPGPVSGTINNQIQLSQQYGKRLKRIMTTVWNPNESKHTAYDCGNWNGNKIKSYQTFIDSIPRQDRILSCLNPAGKVINSDDWLENKKFLNKRSVLMNRAHYALNWFHMDQFFEPHDKATSLPDINLDEGLSMDTARNWQFSGEVGSEGANAIHYMYAEFTREIAVTPEGVIFMQSFP